jgi:hypothetical protein
MEWSIHTISPNSSVCQPTHGVALDSCLVRLWSIHLLLNSRAPSHLPAPLLAPGCPPPPREAPCPCLGRLSFACMQLALPAVLSAWLPCPSPNSRALYNLWERPPPPIGFHTHTPPPGCPVCCYLLPPQRPKPPPPDPWPSFPPCKRAPSSPVCGLCSIAVLSVWSTHPPPKAMNSMRTDFSFFSTGMRRWTWGPMRGNLGSSSSGGGGGKKGTSNVLWVKRISTQLSTVLASNFSSVRVVAYQVEPR